MAMQTIKCGGFVAEEISKVNANFTEIQNDYAKKTELPSVPTKVSELTNDAGYITNADVPTKTSELTNDSNFVNQTQLTNAVNGITVPTKTSELTNDSNFVNTAALNSAIAGIDIPTKTSELTNDSGFATTSALNTKVDKVDGKGLSTNDYTTAEKQKLAGLAAPTKVTFTTSSWSNGTFTTPANGKNPSVVMRKNGSNYGAVLVDVQVVGTNVVITSDEAFEGYVMMA